MYSWIYSSSEDDEEDDLEEKLLFVTKVSKLIPFGENQARQKLSDVTVADGMAFVHIVLRFFNREIETAAGEWRCFFIRHASSCTIPKSSRYDNGEYDATSLLVLISFFAADAMFSSLSSAC